MKTCHGWLAAGMVVGMAISVWAAPGEEPMSGRGPMAGMAPHRGPGMSAAGGGMETLINNPQVVEKLGLTSNQVQQLKQIQTDLQVQIRSMSKDMETAAMKQADLFSQDNPNEDVVMKAVEDTMKLQTDMAKMRMKYLLQAMKVFTPEQRQQLRDIREQRQKELSHRMQKQMERKGGEGEKPPPFVRNQPPVAPAVTPVAPETPATPEVPAKK